MIIIILHTAIDLVKDNFIINQENLELHEKLFKYIIIIFWLLQCKTSVTS